VSGIGYRFLVARLANRLKGASIVAGGNVPDWDQNAICPA